jgi:hypothetical protein
LSPSVSPYVQGELNCQGYEQKESQDLESQTSDHDMRSLLAAVSSCGGIGDCSTSRLEDKSNKVAGYEGEGDGFRGDAGVVGAIMDDDAGEGEVDCCGEEDGSDSKADDITTLNQRA